MTNLTPVQLEEFEQTFRYFDKDNTNTLSVSEFKYALSSLGIVYDNDKLENIFYTITNDNDFATFEQFIQFMVSVTEDKSTPSRIRESFRAMPNSEDNVEGYELHIELLALKLGLDHD